MILYDENFKIEYPSFTESVTCQERKDWIEYLHIDCGFDIETTKREEHSYMYIWSFSIGSQVIHGNTWESFVDLLDRLVNDLDLRYHRRIIIWVANLSFEFQFMRKWLDIGNMFASETRRPIKFTHANCIEFRDALLISGSNLEMLAKIYNLPHKKMIGDLDYSIERNRHDVHQLTEKEIGYIDNDVLILSDFANVMWDMYISNRFVPFTKTNILRQKVKSYCSDLKKIKSVCEQLHPHSWEDYQFIMQWLFRGGYNHANYRIIGQVLNDILSADKTSSYPWAMLTYDRYPLSPFVPKEWTDENLKKYVMYGVFTFKNIRSKTSHSIESYSKAICVKNPLVDNGRIRKASLLCVALTDLDFETYQEFYEWDSMEVLESYGSLPGRLPKYLIQPLMESYAQKNELKKKGLSDTAEYNLKKSEVNSYYGMCVTHIHGTEIVYEHDDWQEPVSKGDFYWKEKKSKFLSPFWGIWICAVSRRCLLSTTFKLGDLVKYSDTDSIYATDSDLFKRVIQERNEEIRDGVEKAILYYGFEKNREYIEGIGEYDFENDGKRYKHFKTLGCKRYIKETEHGVKTTIAGCPKNYFKGQSWEEIEDKFNNKMEVKNCKLRAVYNDEPHTDIINGVPMFEKSSVALLDTDFTLTMDDTWIETLLSEYKRIRH